MLRIIAISILLSFTSTAVVAAPQKFALPQISWPLTLNKSILATGVTVVFTIALASRLYRQLAGIVAVAGNATLDDIENAALKVVQFYEAHPEELAGVLHVLQSNGLHELEIEGIKAAESVAVMASAELLKAIETLLTKDTHEVAAKLKAAGMPVVVTAAK